VRSRLCREAAARRSGEEVPEGEHSHEPKEAKPSPKYAPEHDPDPDGDRGRKKLAPPLHRHGWRFPPSDIRELNVIPVTAGLGHLFKLRS
jgi:hypothetical protein